jgi:putative GTP pyrophosphokinase
LVLTTAVRIDATLISPGLRLPRRASSDYVASSSANSMLRTAYERQRKTWDDLSEEIQFALTKHVEAERIKTHSIGARVKTLESLAAKAHAKGWENPLEEAHDIVGARVVVLFRSDVPRVQRIVRRIFDVMTEEDKEATRDDTTFGYLGVHAVARIRAEHAGPRYDPLKGITFEIQVRTIVQDAWAAVSHHLEYKGGARSVPQPLRKDFFALSGLFYVADQHFEMFFNQAEQAGEDAEQAVRRVARARKDPKRRAKPVAIDADTLRAFVNQRWPDREQASREVAADVVEEVVGAGYTNVAQLTKALEPVDEALEARERERPPRSTETGKHTTYAAIGALRVGLALVDPHYRKDRYEEEHLADVAQRFGLS